MNNTKLTITGFTQKQDRLFLLMVVAINLIIKAIPAGILELGNDEVYYWTYALFPDWSHFDHPPMVGLTIQLFTLNLKYAGEIFLRGGGLIFSSFNIVILFYLVKRIFSRQPAYIAVLLYVSSFYFNIISGFFILPDTPQIFFVLLALYFGLPSFTNRNPSGKENLHIILFGLFTGLAFLSKYHSLFLWFGAGLYILLHNRIWLKKPVLYLSILLTFLLMLPVIYWNFRNNFISFTFHENRVALSQNNLNLISFMQFNLGQIFYQNPVLFAVYALAVFRTFSYIRKKENQLNILLLYLSLPLILIFVILSLFRDALPHWTGPAFLCLLILSSQYLYESLNKHKTRVRRVIAAAMILFVSVIVAGTIEINYGLISFKPEPSPSLLGKNDFTLDMFGWKQAGEKFAGFLEKKGISADDRNNVALVSDNWFPAAHIDYYIASPLHIKLVALGSIERIHKYFWINQERKIKKTDKVFFLIDSRNFHTPEDPTGHFDKIVPEDTLTIFRNNRVAKYVFIYSMTSSVRDSSFFQNVYR